MSLVTRMIFNPALLLIISGSLPLTSIAFAQNQEFERIDTDTVDGRIFKESEVSREVIAEIPCGYPDQYNANSISYQATSGTSVTGDLSIFSKIEAALGVDFRFGSIGAEFSSSFKQAFQTSQSESFTRALNIEVTPKSCFNQKIVAIYTKDTLEFRGDVSEKRLFRTVTDSISGLIVTKKNFQKFSTEAHYDATCPLDCAIPDKRPVMGTGNRPVRARITAADGTYEYFVPIFWDTVTEALWLPTTLRDLNVGGDAVLTITPPSVFRPIVPEPR